LCINGFILKYNKKIKNVMKLIASVNYLKRASIIIIHNYNEIISRIAFKLYVFISYLNSVK